MVAVRASRSIVPAAGRLLRHGHVSSQISVKSHIESMNHLLAEAPLANLSNLETSRDLG